MFRRSVPAALFIDFDNVGRHVLASSITNWTAWIEDGRFDDNGRRRRLVQKRVYWNSQHESLRDAFEANGFEAIICPSRLRSGKSAADMIMALDAFEVATRDRSVHEFIILTMDSDFIPLFERLAGMSKSIVTMANPAQRFIFSTYSDHADIVIPTLRSAEAGTYQRRSFRLSALWRRPEPPQPSPAAPAQAPASEAGDAATLQEEADVASGQPVAEPPKRVGNVEAAAQLIAALAKQNTGSDISRQTITRALQRKFGSVQKNNWFGCGSYKSLIAKAAEIRRDLYVRPALNGGISVRYRASKPRNRPR